MDDRIRQKPQLADRAMPARPSLAGIRMEPGQGAGSGVSRHEGGVDEGGEVAVLFARSDSHYKSIEGCDVFDIDRDARTWSGSCPVIAHPPCRAWGQLRKWAKPRPDEKELAPWAIEQVRRFGGVLEHPYRSSLWPVMGLPGVGERDAFGGWTLPIHQHWWGHRAEKRTKLYIVGIEPWEIPRIPLRLDEPTHTIGLYSGRNRATCKPDLPKAEREHTHPQLAAWLVELARSCKAVKRD